MTMNDDDDDVCVCTRSLRKIAQEYKNRDFPGRHSLLSTYSLHFTGPRRILVKLKGVSQF